jgi:vacuolar-type H+-ATPase subunit I/STV1
MSEEKDVHQSIEELRTFVARRFDEISMEINATSQLLDMAEEDASKRFGEIFETMQAISHKGDGLTPANSGVELEAVVAETEQAANTIMDAVDIISVGIAEKMREEQATEDTKQFLTEINSHL